MTATSARLVRCNVSAEVLWVPTVSDASSDSACHKQAICSGITWPQQRAASTLLEAGKRQCSFGCNRAYCSTLRPQHSVIVNQSEEISPVNYCCFIPGATYYLASK